MQNLIIFGTVISVFLILYMFILPHIIDYQVKETEIVVTLFKILPTRRIPLADIDEIKVCSFWDKDLVDFNFRVKRIANRFCKKGVMIKMRKGFFSIYVLTPLSPEDFVERIIKIKGSGTRI